MLRQPHQHIRPHLSQFGFCLHANIGGRGQTYTAFWKFCYFIIFICEVISHVWVKFIKQKSEAIPIFEYLITFIFQYHNIRVYIFYTNFSKFNSDLAAQNFKKISIIWDFFETNA